ncbi:MAG: outer membrane beta-barrel protein, partial [Terriglobales bacterium]
KSGSNSYHGSILALFRPEATSAQLSGFTATTAISGTQITADKLAQTGFTFSGPIGSSGGTHFFLNGEYSWQDRTSPVTSPVAPSLYVGEYRGWLGYAKVDHQINNNHTLFLRLGADSFNDTNPGGSVGGNTLPTVARIFSRRTYTLGVGETAVLSPMLVNNFRGQFQLGSPITKFSPVLYGTQFQVPVAGVGTFTTGTSQAANLANRQFEFSDTLAWTSGRHTLKFGADVIHAHNGGNSKEFGGPIYLGQFVYNTCSLDAATCEGSAFLNDINNVKSYTQSYGNANYRIDDSLWSLFAQDDIRLLPTFTLNLGLRYERQTFTDAAKDFAPRVGFSWNLPGDSKTVLRGGYGIYYSQIPDNLAANWALTGPTGVFNYTAGPGQIGFPTTVAEAPLPAFPTGAPVPLRTLYLQPGRAAYYDQFLPTSTLIGYQNALLNPYSQQWTLGLQREIAAKWVLTLDYVGSRTIKINRPLDVNPPSELTRTAQGQFRGPDGQPTTDPNLAKTAAQAANCSRPYWIWWYSQNGMTCDPTKASKPQPPYALITSDVNNGFLNYHALDVSLNHRFTHGLELLVSYTWSHALDNVDPDIPQQNPNDPRNTGYAEYGPAIFDQRHRFVTSVVYAAPFKFNVGGIVTLASALPYNITTGTTNSGDNGGTTDRPVINGSVIGRNAGRGLSIYEVSPYVQRPIQFTEKIALHLRAEAFNVFNHPNFVGYNSIYGNTAAAPPTFGLPSTGITAQLPARSLQFSAKLSF